MQSARNINVYRVLVPQKEYEKIFAESKTFHYEGKAQATAKTMGGAASFVPCLAAGTVVGLLTLFGGGGEGPKNFSKTLSKSVNPMREGISRYGYHCQTNIPTAWIQARMTHHQSEVNPNFDPGQANTPIFIIDAGDLQKIWSDGINYKPELPLTNPRGGIIYFHNKKDAFQCAALRQDGLLFDEKGGWHISTPWTKNEQDEAQGQLVKTALKTNTPLLDPVTDIVNEYLGCSPMKR